MGIMNVSVELLAVILGVNIYGNLGAGRKNKTSKGTL